nr:tetratricopeptide repeat protein [Flavobacteriaceae bacterium]
KKEHLNGKSLENSYHQLSQIYNEIGEPQIALKYAKMVLSILNKSEEKNPFLEITAYRSIGNAYRRLNKYEKALIFNKRSCELAEKIFDKGHIKTAYSYAGLAINYINIGDNSNSLIYSKKAKKILLRNFDEMHPDVATCYNNIARAYLNQNRKKMALRYQLKANKSIKNKNFPNTRKGLFCNNLALIYNSLNELDKAYIQQLKAIRYDEKYISSKSILIFKTYYNMVNILIKMGKKNKALTFVEKARNSLTEEMNEEFELLNSLVIDLGRS